MLLNAFAELLTLSASKRTQTLHSDCNIPCDKKACRSKLVFETRPSMSGNEGAAASTVNVRAALARAKRVSVDLTALADHSSSLLNQLATPAIPIEVVAAPAESGSADSEVSLEDVMSRFKAVQSSLISIQESAALAESAFRNDTPIAPTAMGMEAVNDLQDICSNSMQAFMAATANVSMDLIPQASCIQQAVQQQLALFDLLYIQGATLSDARVLDTLEKLSSIIQESSVDPLSVPPSLAPHVSMLSGAASGINWIVSSSTPKEQITDTLNAVPVFGKRVIERGANDSELVHALQLVLRRMLQHVSRFHPNHVVWDCSSAALDKASEVSLARKADDALRHDTNKIFQSDLNFAELYETFYRENVEPWLAVGIHMDEMVQRQMQLCELAFKEQQKLLGSAMLHRQPKNDEEWGRALGHLNMLLDAIEEMGNQRSEACIDKMRMCEKLLRHSS
jgi:hypothetical protein